jgi:hypothetical protein
MQTRLAEEWCERVRDEAEESKDRLAAADNLAQVRSSDGRYAESERIHREVLVVKRRVFGEEHPSTLTSAHNLASSLSSQGKHAESEQIQREVLGVERRVLGEEHPDTLHSLASTRSRACEHADECEEAEESEESSAARFFSPPSYSKRPLPSGSMQGAQAHSRAKAHKLWADRYAEHGNAHKAAAHYKRAFEYGLLRFGADSDEHKPQCIICMDSEPPPIQSGCACRSDTGLAHVECLIDKAVSQQPHRGTKVWWEC